MGKDWWQRWEEKKNLDLNKNYRMFRIPKLKEAIAESTIIGVID